MAASEVTEVQAAVDLVQKQMRNHDGSFLQFRCDEKGFLSICAFGLPGKTHEDSPARAIQVHTPPPPPSPSQQSPSGCSQVDSQGLQSPRYSGQVGKLPTQIPCGCFR